MKNIQSIVIISGYYYESYEYIWRTSPWSWANTVSVIVIIYYYVNFKCKIYVRNLAILYVRMRDPLAILL